MYGWEFPPKNKGGLGVACHGIVEGLRGHNVRVNLVLPYHETEQHAEDFHVHQGLKEQKNYSKDIHGVPSLLHAYQTEETYENVFKQNEQKNNSNKKEKKLYGKTLLAEVDRYGKEAGKMADKIDHDVIHAHDWMTYPAAIEAKKCSNKPLVLHIHATEMDRTGDSPNPHVFEMERIGFETADKIIAVSYLTKNKLVEHYGIDAGKIEVIHNATVKKISEASTRILNQDRQTVLFLGRMTMQKGPDYFLKAAKKVLQVNPNVNFLMVGDGDMMAHIVQESMKLGLAGNIIFTGFLKGLDVDRAFKTADLFVMPSVSEPFGLVALEAIHHGTPVLMSKQSGASEVVPNALKVDFWDIDSMANHMVVALRESAMCEHLIDQSKKDLDRLSWHGQAKKMKKLYHSIA